jgi:hypothetical protein
MIPQSRPAKWTSANIRKLRGKLLLIEGGLLYDNLHFANGDAANPLPRQPARFLFGRFTLSFRSRSARKRTATVIQIAIRTGGISKQRRQSARVSIPIALRSAAATLIQ